MFDKKTIKGIPKSEENLEENVNGYHVFGQNISYQYPQKVINDSKYLTVLEKNKPIIAYTSSTAQIGIINESFYRTGNNGAFQGLFPKFSENNFNIVVFILECIKRTFIDFGYSTSMANVLDIKIQVPIKNRELDFNFMNTFIAELEAERIAELEAERIAELSAYLKVSGLDNYELSSEELKALQDYENIEVKEFEYQEIFEKIAQGRRLKKSDQIDGSIPFVMSGVTNTGIVNYISNPVVMFPKNSITLDIFGNAFYRPYDFGAGDDTGVYWNENNIFTKESMLFITTSMRTSVLGKYDYGKKLRSSQSKHIKMSLPVKNGKPDVDYMKIFTKTIVKLVIKDVVRYADERINATKMVVKCRQENR